MAERKICTTIRGGLAMAPEENIEITLYEKSSNFLKRSDYFSGTLKMAAEQHGRGAARSRPSAARVS
ncbi:hypothetical protein [Pleomorphomonas carboxyditropha]|uniref:hypothetical protein n=1 Tax=Pleomorphomonas carboxyditropha TaxID=2023338 RepID=UPI001055CCDA|nr:hypothetical protein [Pleomorphomonas carboxyditropha]